MSERIEKKAEASIPVQARVNIMGLANLEMYWTSEGYQIRTMSQLIGHSIELLCEILRANQKFERELNTVADANRYLISRGLYQESMRNRSFNKIGKAILFENMRAEGASPEIYANRQYKTLHRLPDEYGKPSTVEPFAGKVDSELIKRATEIHNNLKSEDVVPHFSQEYAMRDRTDSNKIVRSEDAAEFVRVKREKVDLPPLKERGNSKELIQRRIQAADEESQETLSELNNLDPMSLMGSAKKEKSV